MIERVTSVTERLFSLEEPWRSRFLALVASRATGKAWDDGQLPTYREIIAWLVDLNLYREIVRLLDTWQRV